MLLITALCLYVLNYCVCFQRVSILKTIVVIVQLYYVIVSYCNAVFWVCYWVLILYVCFEIVWATLHEIVFIYYFIPFTLCIMWMYFVCQIYLSHNIDLRWGSYLSNVCYYEDALSNFFLIRYYEPSNPNLNKFLSYC